MAKKTLLILTVVILAFSLVVGCSSKDDKQTEQNSALTSNTDTTTETETVSGSITAVGSSALQPLVEKSSQDFMANNKDAKIQVQGGGSGTGLSQVSQGGADIGNSDIFAEEKEGIDASALVDHKVAVVGMAAVVNPNVGIDNVTKQQLIDIFTGKITNWKDLGGADVKITLVNRPASSGTRATFNKYALDGADVAQGIEEDSSGTVRKIIAETEGAIGYLAFSYFDNSVTPLKLDGVEPNSDNVATNQYPVWAYEHMYTKGEPTGVAKAFLDYILTDEVQNGAVKEMGYIPVTAMKVERDAYGNVSNK